MTHPLASMPNLPADADPRLRDLIAAVAEGLTVRAAIRRFFGSNAAYYSQVGMVDKLAIRRLAQANVARQRQGDLVGGRIAVTALLEPARHQAMVARIDQLSEQRRYLVATTDYINALIAADLRTGSE